MAVGILKAYVSGVAFGEKSTPDYTWDGVFVENKWINFTNDVPPLKKIIRLLVGILLVGSCFVLTRLIPDHIRHIKIITIN